jgi:hypothetical protein
MRPKKERGTRSETLSLRLDPKTKFTLEFASRIKGQTITTLVERAIRSSCDEIELYPEGFKGQEAGTWKTFWDPDEGVRTLKLCAAKDYPTTYEEDELMSFVKAHQSFFYDDERRYEINRLFVRVLWPKIEEYHSIWQERRGEDYWAAGRAMAADLSAAKIKSPNWPPEEPTEDAIAY